MNRDLARAQEITKDSETAVSVYIDPSAMREVASGFAGIRSDLRKIAEVVKKALPDTPEAKSLNAQANVADALEEQGVPAQQAQEEGARDPYLSVVVDELSVLEKQYGDLESVPPDEAEDVLRRLVNDSRIATIQASNGDVQLVSAITRSKLNQLLGVVAQAGACTGTALRLVDDLCKYTLSMATGGVAYPESRKRIVAMTENSAVVAGEFLSSPLQSVKAVGQEFLARCESIQSLERLGKYDEADYERGKLFFDVAASIEGLAATGKVAVTQGSKLAGYVGSVRGGKALTAKIGNLEELASLNSRVQFIEIYGVKVQKPLGRGSTGRIKPKTLQEQIALKAALVAPEEGVLLRMSEPMKDSRWPADEGWVKMEYKVRTSEKTVVVHYVRNTVTGAVDDFKFK